MRDEYFALTSRLKKVRLFPDTTTDVLSVHFTQEDIMKLIPHRKPFLFLDTIDKVSFAEKKALGRHFLKTDNNIFKGHFPENPLFPGVLQLEMMGQLGLCLSNLILHNTINIMEINSPVKGIATHIREARFIRSLSKMDTANIHVVIYDSNEIIRVLAGQIYNDAGQLCSLAILEVYFLE